ncbi:MAG: hypothetical protein HQL91_04875 [Magnetococcales bacterium]|nr:hypothetical protein [Magnetococcales bacterium]
MRCDMFLSRIFLFVLFMISAAPAGYAGVTSQKAPKPVDGVGDTVQDGSSKSSCSDPKNFIETDNKSISGEPPAVELSVTPSHDSFIVGEVWTFFLRIRNHSNGPIWIADRHTTVSLPPELWGENSKGGSVGAFFPTVRSVDGIEVVQINKGGGYEGTIKFDPSASHTKNYSKEYSIESAIRKILETDRSDTDSLELLVKSLVKLAKEHFYNSIARIAMAVVNFPFFHPGDYYVVANVHVWNTFPKITGDCITNIGSSFLKTEAKKFHFDSNPWILIIGAIIGGVIAFFLNFFNSLADWEVDKEYQYFLKLLPKFIFGLFVSILLCGIGTILISRVSGTEFLINIKVKDIWGAIATGFFLQWFGVRYLDKISTLVTKKPDILSDITPQGGSSNTGDEPPPPPANGGKATPETPVAPAP